MEPNAAASPRPIAVRFGAMGDMIMFMPALRVLAERWGTGVDVVTSGAWTAAILSHSRVINDLVVMPGTRRRPYWMSPAKQRLVRWLRERSGAPIFVLERKSKFDEFLHRAGVGDERVARMIDQPLADGVHQVEEECLYAANALSPMRAPLDLGGFDRRPSIQPDDVDVTEAHAWLSQRSLDGGPLVLIQPGNKKTMRRGRSTRESNIKYWPVAHWGEVIRGVLSQVPEARIVVCGVPTEQPLALEIAAAGGLPRHHAAADALPLARLFAIQSLAHSMISVDTGPAHSAVAVGCPTVVFYGTTDPARFFPLGSGPVKVVTDQGRFDPDQARWSSVPLTEIKPGPVVEAWRELVGH